MGRAYLRDYSRLVLNQKDTIMANPYIPTLISPNGGETILAGSNAPVLWKLPRPDAPDSRSVQIEIYYCDIYYTNSEPDWMQIAVVPDSFTSYIWSIPNFIHSKNCRMAIRSRNARGERSSFCVSAANFSIVHRKLLMPSVISPINGSRYDKYIEIVPDNLAIIGTYSQRSLYQVFYSSVSANIAPTPIAQNVPIGTKSIIWNTIDIAPANDYVIRIFVQDDDNNTSDSLLINNITIAHEGFFLIDTTPPVASITVNNGAEFTQLMDVTVSVVSYDETTGVQSMQIIEGTSLALPEPPSSVLPFTLSDGDGTKAVQILLQDFGGNRNNTQIQRLFETVLQQAGLNIVDLAIDTSSTAWVITSGTANNLYSVSEYPQVVYTFTDTPTAVVVYNNLTYVATKNAINNATLYRYSGELTSDTIYVFTADDSAINCMVQHIALMYLGSENGNVFSYDGAVVVQIASMPNPIKSLMSDGNSLYLSMENDDNMYILNGPGFVQAGV